MRILSFLFLISSLFIMRNSTIDLSIVAQEHSKMNLSIVTLNDDKLLQVSQVVKKDLEWSNQFKVDCIVQDGINLRKAIKALAPNYSLLIFLTQTLENVLEWRLYDSSQILMLDGKKIAKDSNSLRGLAHRCSDGIWKALTGSPGCFASKIIYCKEKRRGGKSRPYKHIYIADFDGTHVRTLVTTPTVSLAPRFNKGSSSVPLIYYSECTTRNVRLVSTTMSGQRRIISNFDGMNMMVSWSPDGNKSVLCLSKNGGAHIYLNKLVGEDVAYSLEQLTFEGLNVSPCFIDNNQIVFCSDNNSLKKPAICLMNLADRSIKELISGYCSSPSYCFETKKIAYSKRIDGKLQIFIYDFDLGHEEQLTHDSGNKESCSWSPYGNYLLFAVEDGIKSQIALLNLKTKERKLITPDNERCSYPAWSPIYDRVPFID